MNNPFILTIITINWNNERGLEKTIQSVLSQTFGDFEYIIVDGASSDGSVEIIRKYAGHFGPRLKWVSESDEGIYNAMNKGIGIATGTYLEFLNSGDVLVSKDVLGVVSKSLQTNSFPSILYGNTLKDMSNSSIVRDKCFAGKDMTLLGFYEGTLNHSPAFIRRSLFEKYGLYDDTLKIVSDWKWYLKAIVFGEEKPVYVDIDVTLFDMTGISETNKELDKTERRQVLTEMVPKTILSDYDQWSFPIDQMKRLKRHTWAYKLVWFLERCLFKWERLGRTLTKTQEWL